MVVRLGTLTQTQSYLAMQRSVQRSGFEPRPSSLLFSGESRPSVTSDQGLYELTFHPSYLPCGFNGPLTLDRGSLLSRGYLNSLFDSSHSRGVFPS